MGELRLCPRVRIYCDVQQHFAVVGRREVLQSDDGVLGDDGTPFAFFPIPRSSTLRSSLNKSVLEKRQLEERAWEPSTLEVSKATQQMRSE